MMGMSQTVGYSKDRSRGDDEPPSDTSR